MADKLEELADLDLARHARAGSIRHFEELLTRYEKRIYNFILSRIGCPEDAEDLTQSVFLKAYRNIGKYDENHKFATWLFCIARRESASFYRTGRPEMVAIDENSQTDISDPRSVLSDREDFENLWEFARQTLSEEQFTALWIKYREDMGMKETAKVMGKSHSSIKVLLHRGRKRLLKKMVPEIKQELLKEYQWRPNNDMLPS